MVVREKFIFNKTYEKVGVASSHFSSHCNAVDLLVVVVCVRTSLARRSKVSELGLFTGRWFKKYFSAWRPSLLGITVYKIII